MGTKQKNDFLVSGRELSEDSHLKAARAEEVEMKVWKKKRSTREGEEEKLETQEAGIIEGRSPFRKKKKSM